MIASTAWTDYTQEGGFWNFGGGRDEQRITGVQWYTDWEIADGGSASKIRTVRGDDAIYMFYQKWQHMDSNWASSSILDSYVQKLDERGVPIGEAESLSFDGSHFRYVSTIMSVSVKKICKFFTISK